MTERGREKEGEKGREGRDQDDIRIVRQQGLGR